MFKIISYIILAAINIFTVYDNNFIINYINNILINTNTQKYNLTNKAINFIIKLKTERKYQLLIENIENKSLKLEKIKKCHNSKIWFICG